MKNNQKGFHLTGVLLVVVVVMVLALVGWYVYDRQKDDSGQSSTPTSQTSDVPEVKSSDDLTAAENYLNNTDLDKELDTSEIDAALNQ